MSSILRQLATIRRYAKAAPAINSEDGVMLAFDITDDVAGKLLVDDGVARNELHCTYVYVGKASKLDPVALKRLPDVAAAWAARRSNIPVVIAGVGRFSGVSDDGDPVIALVDSPQLTLHRPALVKAMRAAGIHPKENHGYTAHITLSYVPAEEDTPIKRIPPIETEFTHLSLHIAGKVTRYEFT